MPSPVPLSSASYAARINFVVELAERLHAYGTTAQRLEGAVSAVAQQLRLECEPWSNPTGMILTFSDPQRPPGDNDTTRVIRLPPGENDLYRLAETDRIAEEVVAGRLDLGAAHAQMSALDRPPSWRFRAMQVLAYGLAATAIGGVLRLPWLDIAVAGLNGLVIGLFVHLSESRPHFKEALEAVMAM